MAASTTEARGESASFPPLRTLALAGLLFVAFAGIGLTVYGPALSGPFLSDDQMFIGNPHVMAADSHIFAAAFDVDGELRFFSGGNYMPIAFIAHAVQWRLWQRRTRGYHLTNVLLHALNATLLVGLLIATGVGRIAATAAGALFMLHPANVEAVAWISQLRTLLAMSFTLVALLLFRGRPWLSAVPFTLALLCKAVAAFALPMLGALYWGWHKRRDVTAAHRSGLALWVVAFVIYAPIQLLLFSHIAGSPSEPYPDLATQIRSITALGARYLAMAYTGYGIAAFHEVAQTRSWLDGWWLAGLAMAPLLLWRIAATLRRGSAEAAWWIGAAAAFVPVCQIIPFLYPMADRYLYFMLPGLLGGVLLAGTGLWPAVERGLTKLTAGRAIASALPAIGLLATLALAVTFGVHANARAALWVGIKPLYLDSAAHYPEGAMAPRMQAIAALDAGDLARAFELLKLSMDRNGDFLFPFRADPNMVRIQDDPRFQELQRESSRKTIRFIEDRGLDGPMHKLGLATAYLELGELDRAIEISEGAIANGGSFTGQLSSLAMQARSIRSRLRRDAREQLE
jgi:hypothetical protein